MALMASAPDAESIWAVAVWMTGAALLLAVEALVQPRSRRPQRPLSVWAIQFGLWSIAFSLLLLLSQRPVFAAGLALAGALLLVLVNNAKYQALREPFLFSDFGLFSQALKHPRLYLPFLGLGKALLGAAAIGGSIGLGLFVEPPLPPAIGWPAFATLVVATGLVGIVLLRGGGPAAPAPSLKPLQDLRTLGLAASLWLYWRLETATPVNRRESAAGTGLRPPQTRHRPLPERLPHIVAVQSESFFDPRRLLDTVNPAVLMNFDRIRKDAELHGTLQVPAWGANTMRTEFGFLTGIAADELGIHRFNPYRKLARHPTSSLAAVARSLGYRTLCIHPHPASFFGRDSVYPHLGFDEFIDIQQFDATETCGPYICDAAVGRMIGRQLASSNRPLFVFAITMENHGPLHLEKVAPGDSERCYRTPPPAGFDDLTVYLRHLANADRMLGDLTTLLSQQQREGLLCWFGDHVPSLPSVYAALDFNDGRTDYLLWRTRHHRVEYRDLAVEDLGQALLKAMLLQESPRCDTTLAPD